MIMTSSNPYSPASAIEDNLARAETLPTQRLWIAYGIAPLVAPVAAALTVFIIAVIYQTTHPEDPEINPLALVFAPAALLILGVPASYGVAGVIGMPIVYWLRRTKRLNAYTVHGTALSCAAVLCFAMSIAGGILAWSEGQRSSLSELLLGCIVIFLMLTPFTLLSATIFWLIGVRGSRRVTT